MFVISKIVLYGYVQVLVGVIYLSYREISINDIKKLIKRGVMVMTKRINSVLLEDIVYNIIFFFNFNICIIIYKILSLSISEII